MRNEHVRQMLFFLQFLQQVDDLRLNGNIQSGYAFVADNELRLNRERTRDADTLALTAGELVRIPVQHVFLQTALFHRIDDVLTQFRRAVLEELVRDKTFLDDLTDRETRIQAGVRVLEDDLQVLAQRTHFGIAQTCEVDTVIQHRFILLEFGIARIFRLDSVELCLKFRNLLIHYGNGFVRSLQRGFRFCLLALDRRLLVFRRFVEDMLIVLEADLFVLTALDKRFPSLVLVIALYHQIARFGIIFCKETAENLDDVAEVRLHFACGNVAFLQQIGICSVFAAGFLNLLLHLVRFRDRFLQTFTILPVVADRVDHIRRRHLVDGRAVIQRTTCGLRIELQQNTTESRLSAAGLTDDTERFAFIDINRDIFVRTNVQTLLLEDGGFRNREVLLQVSD